MRNAGLNFVCREVTLKVEHANSAFTNAYTNGDMIRIPVAHHDGNYFADDETLRVLRSENRVAFRYCDENGDLTPESNPNGSIDNIAGVYNDKFNVLGMMPHPERLIDPALGGTDGLPMFEGLVESLAA